VPEHNLIHGAKVQKQTWRDLGNEKLFTILYRIANLGCDCRVIEWKKVSCIILSIQKICLGTNQQLLIYIIMCKQTLKLILAKIVHLLITLILETTLITVMPLIVAFFFGQHDSMTHFYMQTYCCEFFEFFSANKNGS
jgi:hypothetical protein